MALLINTVRAIQQALDRLVTAIPRRRMCFESSKEPVLTQNLYCAPLDESNN